MKKILSISSMVISLGILLSAFYIFNQLQRREIVLFSENEAKPIQNLLTLNQSYYDEESQRYYEFNVDLIKVNQELERRDEIISKSEDFVAFIMGLSSLLFLFSIYFLVVSFQEKKILQSK
jgi:hypothetical protein